MGPPSGRRPCRIVADGKEPVPVRESQVRTERPRDLRRRIERLDGLPLRPATARRVLDGAPPADPAAWAALDAADPGWALDRSRGIAVEPLRVIAERPWWPALSGAAVEAVDRL